jgi:hypothetical protein
MMPAALSLIPFLALTLWRFVFTGLRCGWLVSEIDAPRPRHNGLLAQRLHILDPGLHILDPGLHILDPASLALVAGDLEKRADGLDPVDRKYRAQSYLRRIVALTGATQIGNSYFLDVGKTQFFVRAGYVRRLRDATDPKCTYEETCFYPAHKGMPKAEEIATALLQLKNNPALFDGWAAQNHVAFKADGGVFTHAR